VDLELTGTDDNQFGMAIALAGYFVAHGLWSVSDGAALMPMIAHEGPAGRGFQRFVGGDLGAGARRAEQVLDDNPHQAMRAVMVVDGYLDIDGVQHDALIARVVEYGPPRRSLHIVLPYRPLDSTDGFAVHSPRFGNARGLTHVDLDGLGRAFFAGVGAHVAAAPIWTAHLDESI
jgi:hypothetical protein